MMYFKTTADASDQYRATSASGPSLDPRTAVPGNLADEMRNSVVVFVEEVVENQPVDGTGTPPSLEHL
jgi:hypothetical protein